MSTSTLLAVFGHRIIHIGRGYASDVLRKDILKDLPIIDDFICFINDLIAKLSTARPYDTYLVVSLGTHYSVELKIAPGKQKLQAASFPKATFDDFFEQWGSYAEDPELKCFTSSPSMPSGIPELTSLAQNRVRHE